MANNEEFAVGQLVRLKSGGPDMTVERVFPPQPGLGGRRGYAYRCQWFAGKKLDSGDFPPESLTVVQPADSSD
jgi:uncharacterized protein YodC (DUF2158 family)